MTVVKKLLGGVLAIAIAASVAAPASATTLIRAGLDELVAANGTVVVGEVLDAHSYWNKDRSFILTDVRFAASDVLKGRLADKEFTVTIMGGRVGDLTTLIIGGAELIPGNSYVLFLNEEPLPGKSALTVRDLSQGAFDIVIGKGGLRAVSQATRQPLLPDSVGRGVAEGGLEGILLNDMVKSIREISARQSGRQEVN